MVRYYDLNKPIPELNNLSLTQVFEDGNTTSLNDFSTDNATKTTFDDYILIQDDGSGTYYATWDTGYQLNTNEYIYHAVTVSSNDNIDLLYQVRYSSIQTPITFTNLSNNKPQTKSSITSGGTFTGYLRFLTYNLGTSFKVYQPYAINLTSLGIDLTKEQMDYWFSIYQDSKGAVGSAFVQHAGIDTVIPNLNNKTLREVFEGGQLVTENYYASLGGTSYSLVNGKPRVTADTNVSYLILVEDYSSFNTTHTYYANAETVLYDADGGDSTHRFSFNNYRTNYFSSKTRSSGVIYNSGIYSPSGTPDSFRIYFNGSYPAGSYFDTNYFNVIDLTALGIDTLTQAEMDYYFSLYQSWKQKTLYIGKSKNLLRNDLWEQGTYNTSTGVLLTSTTRVRGIFEIQPDTTYVRIDGTLYFRSQGFYDENMTFIGVQNSISGSSFTTPLNAKFVILVYSLTSLGTETITPQDVVDGQPQLEQRTFATNYEQYYTPKTWIAPAFQQHALTDTKLIDTKLAYLNGYSIREVFESNLLVNGDFSDGTSGWQSNNPTVEVVNGIATFDDDGGTSSRDTLYQNFNINTNDSVYFNFRTNRITQPSSFHIDFFDTDFSTFGGTGLRMYTSGLLNTWETRSKINTFSFSNVRLYIFVDDPDLDFEVQMDYIYAINLTALGIDHLTQAELDQMFALYQDRNKNLFDGTYELNKYINSSGALATSADWAATNYIPIQPNTTYVQNLTLTVSTATYPAFYDSNYNFISVGANNSNTYTSPANAYYLRTCWRYSSYTPARFDFQVELGTTATPYHAYGGFSLKDVFETGNLVTNGDFSDGTTGWSISGAVSGFQVNDGIASFTATSNNSYVYQQKTLTLNNKYYYTSLLKADYPTFYLNAYLNASPYTTLIADYYNDSGVFETHSGIVTNNISTNNFVIRLRDYSESGWTPVYFDDIYLLDLTTLNIADLTKDFMDDLYGAYSKTYQAPAFIDKYGVLNAPSFQVTAGLDTAFADLNGLTLREVFEGEYTEKPIETYTSISTNRFDNITEVNGVVSGTYNANNNILAQFIFIGSNVNANTNDVVYYTYDVKQSKDIYTSVYGNWNGTNTVIDNGGQPISTNWKTYSQQLTASGTITIAYAYLGITGTNASSENEMVVQLRNYYAINLTALGINLTKEQMDWYFELYKSWSQE